MSEQRFMISDASKKLDVEPHVLRYWEEELEMEIPRNEMGHRYYLARNLKVLKCIKELKQQGFQLKAIKLLMPELEKTQGENLDKILGLKEELNQKAEQDETVGIETEENQEIVAAQPEVITEMDEKMQQFHDIMNKIISNALKENNESLGKSISGDVSTNVIKEMDYLLRMKDEREEERYKRLDETIRGFQKARQEAAVAIDTKKVKKRKKRRLFGRK